ncbi:putative metal-binding motif-containing protein [Melittangium boletus]|uniref:putative metal-binding motif-containing protein n=1 Tax=Melittangium boletus TaxID=83453 RepID=UPI003DA5199B
MHRAGLLLLLVLAGCGKDPGAVHALIRVDADVRASCIALDLLRPDGTLIQTQQVTRPSGRDEVSVGVFRGQLPEQLQLQARALWGGECGQASLRFNGQSPAETGRFESGKIQQVVLTLQRPGAALDRDRDGFVSAEAGGPDCDDDRAERKPEVQELCDGSDDLNCDGKRGCDDATCSTQACERMPTALAFVDAAHEREAGACSRPLTIERMGSDGLATRPNLPTPLTLENTLPSGATLHADANCSSSLSTPSIPPGQSRFTFYVRGTTAGNGQLLASSTGLATTQVSHAIVPGPGSPVLKPSQDTALAGVCNAVEIEWRDAFGNLSRGTPRTVKLEPGAGVSLHRDRDCAQPLAALPEGSTHTVYVRGTTPKSFDLVVASGNMEARQALNVIAGPPKRLEFPSGSQTLLAGECASPVGVRILDEFGNPTSFPTATTLTLSSDATGDFGFHPESGCTGAPLSSLPVPAGAQQVNFRFKGKTGGKITLTASQHSLTGVNQQHDIIPLVRRGQCTLANNQTGTNCAFSPALRDLSKSFLVFQATTTTDAPEDSFVRCLLEAGRVVCNRRGNKGEAVIQWQVVEKASGLRVQHLTKGCTGQTTSVTFNPVDLAKSFVLFSAAQDGAQTGNNDIAGVQFTQNNQVDVVLMANCFNNTYNVQVVEMDGALVSRGKTGKMTGSALSATGLEPEQAKDRTALLTTLTTKVESDANICNRMVRSELSTANSIAFSRYAEGTCDTADVEAVYWERISFPTGSLVQDSTLSVVNTQGKATATLSSPVDPTRTLLMASSQVSGGQGNGETGYKTRDIPGAGTGRLTLLSPTTVQVERDALFDFAKWTTYAIQLEP